MPFTKSSGNAATNVDINVAGKANVDVNVDANAAGNATVTVDVKVTVRGSHSPRNSASVRLDETNFEKETSQPGRGSFVWFHALWDPYSKEMADAWEELAKKYANNPKVLIADVVCSSVDGDKSAEVCTEMKIFAYPTLMYRVAGSKKWQTYEDDPPGARSFKAMSAFVEKTFLRGKQSASVTLDETSFEKETSQPGRASFVWFHALWDRYSKEVEADWEELAKKYANNPKVLIADVVCSSVDGDKSAKVCVDMGIYAYPTLMYKVAGSKEWQEYDDMPPGARSFRGMSAFVEKTFLA